MSSLPCPWFGAAPSAYCEEWCCQHSCASLCEVTGSTLLKPTLHSELPGHTAILCRTCPPAFQSGSAIRFHVPISGSWRQQFVQVPLLLIVATIACVVAPHTYTVASPGALHLYFPHSSEPLCSCLLAMCTSLWTNAVSNVLGPSATAQWLNPHLSEC